VPARSRAASHPGRDRLDKLLVDRGLAPTRERARRLVMAGQVLVDNHPVDKPGSLVKRTAALDVRGSDIPYVSRGGVKLAAALQAWPIPVHDCVALDAGASTGGWTDCLLQHGARRVYAVDVGYGQFAWTLRNDPRVILYERANIRSFSSRFDEPPTVVVADVSFISLRLVLPKLVELAAPAATFVLLVKPQFEVGKGLVGKGGVVRDPSLHRAAIDAVRARAEELALTYRGEMESPIQGPAGNREFLLWLENGAPTLANG
jgi:23S rRNA (cytidine1920-2'-O)/16S rRNA (cytidine1409-2'-O)-methyltransferase